MNENAVETPEPGSGATIRAKFKPSRALMASVKPKPPAPTPGPSRTRSDRLARQLALAHWIEQAVEARQAPSYGEVARALGLTESRITQITSLLGLSPALQEQVLLEGGLGIREALRAAREVDWGAAKGAITPRDASLSWRLVANLRITWRADHDTTPCGEYGAYPSSLLEPPMQQAELASFITAYSLPARTVLGFFRTLSARKGKRAGLSKEDLEDLTQDLYVSLASQGRLVRGEPDEVVLLGKRWCQILKYAASVAKNKAVDRRRGRARARRACYILAFARERALGALSPRLAWLRAELRRTISRELAALP